MRHINRRQFISTVAWSVPALFMGSCSTTKGNRPFSIIALPDTQYYCLRYPEMFYRQVEWIVKTRKSLNTLCVVHLGDITDHNTIPEWEVAHEAFSRLDDVVPYCLTVGNHDMPGVAKVRDTSVFNKYFPLSRLKDKAHFGGTYNGGVENAYYLFEDIEMKLMIVCLEFGARDEVLDWAGSVINNHPRHKVIIATHCYMNFDDTRVGPGDRYNPHNYGCGGNDGEEIWTKLVSKFRNIFLVLSGHILGDGLGRLSSQNNLGSSVQQVLCNYQMKPNGGNGWLRIMQFHPERKQINCTSYSPALDQYAIDDQNKFIMEVEYL